MSNKDFYRAFEDRFRGQREDIKKRVAVYLPLADPMKDIYPEGMALDIGCGRGEWLELLVENGFNAKGIDLDKGMLKACTELDLNVQWGNGIEYLKEQKDESYVLLSAFHVVEHISFQDLHTLVEEALRVLKPGGILILETPNPENIKVATEYFYLDPTHVKPIPSDLLAFLPEYYGFVRTKVMRLNGPEEILDKRTAALSQVIKGVSPDYAVVSQKNVEKKVLERFDAFFAKNTGVSLDLLLDKFETRCIRMETLANKAYKKAHDLQQSRSWKITKPLRDMSRFLKHFASDMKH